MDFLRTPNFRGRGEGGGAHILLYTREDSAFSCDLDTKISILEVKSKEKCNGLAHLNLGLDLQLFNTIKKTKVYFKARAH